ncbi:hypothetical protein BDW27_11640 [Nocardiopsis sp. L17-MgMaSL7]|nr:hypothetical protein BDW27_11640 [Nocardiopsis sp. L17-MgMaSL7]
MVNGLGANGLSVCDRLHDHVALDEIELYAEVLIAVADTDHRLSPAEIDRALGLTGRYLVGDQPGGDGVRETDTAEKPPVSPTETSGSDKGVRHAAPGPTGTAPVRRKRPRRGAVPEQPSEVRYAGPVPPARDGHRPPTFVMPVQGGVQGGSSASHPLCDVVLPHFVPWRAWHL